MPKQVWFNLNSYIQKLKHVQYHIIVADIKSMHGFFIAALRPGLVC